MTFQDDKEQQAKGPTCPKDQVSRLLGRILLEDKTECLGEVPNKLARRGEGREEEEWGNKCKPGGGGTRR